MKISDDKLLQLIWENQLRLVASKVIAHYIGGGYGLHEDNDFWFQSCSSENRISRGRITSDIGAKQLLARIRRLYLAGCIASGWGDSLIGFYIPGEQARRAFEAARQWWLDQGMPEGSENGRSRTTQLAPGEFERMVGECRDYLRLEYPQCGG